MKKSFIVSLTTVGVILAVFAAYAITRHPAHVHIQPASLGTVEPFRLIDQSGQDFGSDELVGHYWIANFIFTRCAGPCPVLTAHMKKLTEELSNRLDIRFVSFTVDPEFDVPAVLTQYAAHHHANDPRWTFLTGEPDLVRRIIRDNFFVAIEAATKNDHENHQITHSVHFVLVEPDGTIINFYSGQDADALDRLRRDIAQRPRLGSSTL